MSRRRWQLELKVLSRSRSQAVLPRYCDTVGFSSDPQICPVAGMEGDSVKDGHALPADFLRDVFAQVNIRTVCIAAQVCSSWNELAKEGWKARACVRWRTLSEQQPQTQRDWQQLYAQRHLVRSNDVGSILILGWCTCYNHRSGWSLHHRLM